MLIQSILQTQKSSVLVDPYRLKNNCSKRELIFDLESEILIIKSKQTSTTKHINVKWKEHLNHLGWNISSFFYCSASVGRLTSLHLIFNCFKSYNPVSILSRIIVVFLKESVQLCSRLNFNIFNRVLPGHHVEMAKQHRALLLAVEHRFYGDSINPDGLKTENLADLSSQQALVSTLFTCVCACVCFYVHLKLQLLLCHCISLFCFLFLCVSLVWNPLVSMMFDVDF